MEDFYNNEENLSLSYLVDKLIKENEELKDRYLRQAAEFDNYRKRTQSEKADLIKTAGEKTISSILPVLDDFERALEQTGNITTTQELVSCIQGFGVISKKLSDILKSSGLEKFDPTGEEFNSDYHEAISLINTGNPNDSGKVVQCIQPGYKLGSKIIRYAKVIVAQ